MKKRLVLQWFIIMIASTLDAALPQQNCLLSRIYNESFTPQVDQSAQIGSSGSLDDTFNQTEGSVGSIDLSTQLPGGIGRAVVALPGSNFLVALSVSENDSNVGMYNAQGILQIDSYAAGSSTPGIVDLGNLSYMVQAMILDVQGRAIVCGGTGATSSGWLQRIEADGSGKTYFITPSINSWSNVAAVATQSTGNIIAVGSNGSNGMIGRYLVEGGIDTTFGSNGYVTFDGSDQLPNCLSGIYSIVVDSQDRIYIPYLQDDNTVWIIRLLADGTPDASWFSFITNRVAVPYLNNATASQLRMALDVNNNLIIAAQVGTAIQVTGIQASDGSAAPLDPFTSSGFTSDQLNLYSLITTQDNSILLAGSNSYTGYNTVIKLIGSNIFPGAGQLDTSFNQTGYNFYKSNELSTAGGINSICLSSDGRIYAANYQTIASVDSPYISRLYNIAYDSQIAQEPATQEQGIIDLSFGDNGTQTYRGIMNPYFGNYRGNLQQQGKALVEVTYLMNGEGISGVGDLLVGTNGLLNNFNSSNMILNWLTPEGLFDTNFGTSSSGQLALDNITSANETINSIAQDRNGNLYVAGNSYDGISNLATLIKYTNQSTNGWTNGSYNWNQTYSGYGQFVALQGTGRALLCGYDQDNHGFIVGYDQATGHIANGTDEASVFGDYGTGVISYNSDDVYMGQIYSVVVNNAGDIFVAYQNVDTPYVDIAAFFPDGSGFIPQFGTNGIVTNVFSQFPVQNQSVRIAQANTGNLLVCACDDNNIYLARLDGVTGQLDTTFHQTDEGSGVVIIPLANAQSFALQGVSDGSILISGSCQGNRQMFTVRVGADGLLDTTFNGQSTTPGYEIIDITGVDTSSVLTSLAVQSTTGNIVTAGYQTLSDYDASPVVFRSFGQPGTTGVMSYPTNDIYPGTLDTSLNGTGGLDLSTLISSGIARIVFAYPSGNEYQGMLLIGIDTGSATIIARVNETYMSLDTTFGNAGLYTVSPSYTGLNALIVDGDNNIIIAGTSAGAGWAQQLSPNGQSYVECNLPSTWPHNVTQINAIGQQKSGRYILVGSDANQDLLIMAFQNKLVDDNTMLELDLTFNPLGIVAPVGTYIVGGIAGALYNLVINDDDTLVTAVYDSNQSVILVEKVLANGSGLDSSFGSGGIVTTSINTFDRSSVKIARDNEGNIIVAAATWVDSTSNAVAAARYDASGGTSTAFTGSGVIDGVQYIQNRATDSSNLNTLLETADQQTILLGASNNGAFLYAVRLDATGALDATWNPYAVSPDTYGILNYYVENAGSMNNACIGISGNVFVAGTYVTEGYFPILIEINGDTYVQQVQFSPLAAPAGALDYTLDRSGALNLNLQLGGSFGIPRQLSILSNQSMLMAFNNGSQAQVAQLNAIFNLDTGNFNSSGTTPGYVVIDNANSVNDMFVANAQNQDGSIYVAGGANVNETNLMWAAIISADGQTVTPLAAPNSLDNGCAIRLGQDGKVLVAGHAGSTGIIVAYNSNLTAIDTTFGLDGYYSTGVDSVIGAMTVDSQGRIYIAYVVNDENGGTLYIQRILADGRALDTDFGISGAVTVFTGESSYSYTQLFIQLDETNGYLVSAALDERGQFIQVNRWDMNNGQALGSVPVYVGAMAESWQLSLSHLFLDADANIYVVGYMNVSPYNTILARITNGFEGEIVLDPTYARYNVDYPGVAAVAAGPLAGPGDYSIGSGILDQDGRVYVVGKGGDEQPYMARLFGDNYYQEVDQAVEVTPTPPTPPAPEPMNGAFWISYTGDILELADGGSTAVDSLQRVLVGGITTDHRFVVARFLQDGTLDLEFNGSGITQSPILNNLLSGFFVAVDTLDNVYIAGVTSDETFIVAKFLGLDGSLDTDFNHDGVLTEIPGIAQSYQITNLVSGGYVAIDYLGNILVGGATSNNNLGLARFRSDGSIDDSFGQVVPGISTVTISNLRYGGYVTTNPSVILADNSIYLGASTIDNTLLIVKFDRYGNIDTDYAVEGIAQTVSIANLVAGGPIALNDDRKVVIGGYTSDKTFVAARFGLDGFFDPTFNGNGIVYSNPLPSLHSCCGTCIDSNNNVLLSGTSTAVDGVSVSMVVARMTVLGAIDTTLSPTGLLTTGTIAGLQSGGFVATDALSNIFTGGFDTDRLVLAGLYSGAQIFVTDPQVLPASVFKVFWYGNNPDLFKDYLGVEFYAQLISDQTIRQIVIDQVELSLDEYADFARMNLGFILAACTTPTWDGNLGRLQAVLIDSYPESSDEINQFFINFNNRRIKVRRLLLPFTSSL